MSLTMADFERAAARIGCSVAAVQAVTAIEARGGGFNPNGSLKTLFEAHHFHRFTGGKWTQSHPHLSSRRWDRSLYGRTWLEERRRLAAAMALDRNAALMSTSWGMFQIMGFNHRLCGYDSAQAMVDAFDTGEPAQLDGFVAFIIARGLDDEMQSMHLPESQAAFARVYNGPGYAQNEYDIKLGRAFRQAQAGTLRLAVMA